MITALILSACAAPTPITPGQFSITREQPTATALEPTATERPADKPSGPSPTPTAIQPGFQARLSVLTSMARVFKAGGSGVDVFQAQSGRVEVNDRVEVTKPEGQTEQSYGVLHFPDFLTVELFNKSSIRLAGVSQQENGLALVNLELNAGHMFVQLNEESPTQVTVTTLFATITTLSNDTEFNICQTEALTCIVVTRGLVEITTPGWREIVKAGSAGYVLKNEPPSAVFCAPTPVFRAWAESFRRLASAPTLDVKMSELAQEPCRLTSRGLPLNARVLYRDEFRSASSGWWRGNVNNFVADYVDRRYYQIQIQGANEQYLAYVPNPRTYEDAGAETRVLVETAGSEEFRYGLILRRTGDNYYVFSIAPQSETWYFLKSSRDGIEVLKEGTGARMRGLEGRDILRVEAYGPTFLLYINNRFIELIRDFDYASGEVGLFVESMESSDAFVRFDSMLIWNIPDEQNPFAGISENCFNGRDDDGDGLVDKADPNCQRPDPTATPEPTETPRPTRTPKPTSTPTSTPVTPSSTPVPSNTPVPTNTFPPTNTPVPTNTLPLPTLPLPTDTPVPATNTPVPPTPAPATNTPVPPTPVPATNTPVPPTDPPAPTATDPPVLPILPWLKWPLGVRAPEPIWM